VRFATFPWVLILFLDAVSARWHAIPLKKFLADDKISPAVRKFAQDIFPVRSKTFYFPDHSLNAIDISYFLNHSDNPNVGPRADGNEFVTLRNIKKGEELFSDYRTYTDG